MCYFLNILCKLYFHFIIFRYVAMSIRKQQRQIALRKAPRFLWLL